MPPAAIALGWQVADLFHPHGPASDPGLGPLLPERSDFSAATQAKWLVQEIEPQIMALLPDQFPQPPSTDLQEVLTAVEAAATATPQVDLRQAVFKLHEQLLDDLGAADVRLGKAYGLGQTLAEVALTADSDLAEFRKSFQDGRVTQAEAWLFDLKALLPDYTSSRGTHAGLNARRPSSRQKRALSARSNGATQYGQRLALEPNCGTIVALK